MSYGMNKYMRLYPEMYKKDNSGYTYYTDFGKKVHLTAGRDGVTEEHIATLKELHRNEANNERRNKRYRKVGEHYRTTVSSIEAILEASGEDSIHFMDEKADIESLYLENEEQNEFRKEFINRVSSLSVKNKEIFRKLWIDKLPKNMVAEQEGVSVRMIHYRAASIVKILKNDG